MAETGHWMPMYWADYIADTTHLNTFQHGIYLLLIAAYWRRGGPISADPGELAQMARTTKDKLARYGNPVLAMFTCKDGLLHHKRVDLEILRSSERLKSARANGRAGGLAKSKLITITTTNTQERKKESSLRSDSPNAKAPRPSKTMIPENCPTVDDQKLAIDYWLRKERPDLVDRLSDEVQAFRAHHRKDGSRMADWSAAWTTWYGNAVRFNKPPGQLFSQQPATWKPLKVGT